MGMKFAFMTFSTPTLSLSENLALAKELGFAGIEPRTDSDHRHGIEVTTTTAERVEIAETVSASGVELAALALSARFADEANVERHVEVTKASVRLAADVGCRRVRVFGGAFNENLGRHTAITTASEALKKVGDVAGEWGVDICLETHDAWCDPRDVVRLMEATDHPAVGVNWDVLHPTRVAGFSLERTWELLHPWVRHVHVHDGTGDAKSLKLVPIGEGLIDHGQVLRILREAGYEGYVSGEWISGLMDDEFFKYHLAKEIEKLKRLEAELA